MFKKTLSLWSRCKHSHWHWMLVNILVLSSTRFLFSKWTRKSRCISNSSHCSTTILSKHMTSAFTAVKDHVMKNSETAFSKSNVNYFWSIKTLPRSSKSCDGVTFRVLKYLFSTFLLYTPHCHMILSKQKRCLWSTGVSTESQNLTSALHFRQDFLATRNMTRIDVGLARSYVKFLLSSLKTYMCNFDGIVYQQIVLWALTVLHL